MHVAFMLLCLLLLTGFELLTVRWPSPVIITLRCMQSTLPEGFCALASYAAALWQSESVTIRIIAEHESSKSLCGNQAGTTIAGYGLSRGLTLLLAAILLAFLFVLLGFVRQFEGRRIYA